MDKKKLKLIYPEDCREQLPQVSFKSSIFRDDLCFEFEVRAKELFTNATLPHEKPAWGLWDWDVVEVFIQPNLFKTDYYEFQLSPLGQFFELEIFEPRVSWNDHFRSNLKVESQVEDKNDFYLWLAKLSVPKSVLGLMASTVENELKGNAFAILGSAENRTYWSLHGPRQSVPDFHRPQYFGKL